MQKVAFALAASGGLAAATSGNSGADEPAYLLSCPRDEKHAAQLKSLEIDDVVNLEKESYVFASNKEFAALNATSAGCRVLDEAKPLRAQVPDGYTDLQGIYDFLRDVERQYPSIAQVVDLSRLAPPGVTDQGRPLPMIKISDNVQQDEDEPNLIFISAHHAREIITPQIAMDMIDDLTKNYATDPSIKAIVDNNEIFISPQWNPDGYDYVWEVNNFWRKNRKNNGNGSFGVDQNRNYPYGWSSSCSGSTNPSSETYKGPSSASEEETQTLLSLVEARNFAKALDFHSFGREVLLSQRCMPLPSAMSALNIDEGTALAGLANYVTRLPSGDGQHQGWHMARSTTYSYLVETETTFQPSFARAKAESERVKPLIKRWFEQPIPVVGNVVDATTGAPIEAQFTVDGWYSPNGIPRRSDGKFGRYHLWLSPGTYTVTASAPNYNDESRVVTVLENQSVEQAFQMRRAVVASE